MPIDPGRLIAAYEKGVCTSASVVALLTETAADAPPEDWLPELPGEWAALLYEHVAGLAAASPDRWVSITAGTFIRGPEHDAFVAERRRRTIVGVERLTSYFRARAAESGDES